MPPKEAPGSQGQRRSSSDRKKVEWDERNLAANAEYQRLHPVTMHIDEPKTPYVHMTDEEVQAMERDTWDPEANRVAHEVKERILNEQSGRVVAPVKNGRPQLAAGTASGELAEELHNKQFRKFRSQVYADEGAKFKAMLAKKQAGEEDGEDE